MNACSRNRGWKFLFGGLVFSLLSLLRAQAGADAWPEFRGPTGQGMSTATNLPVYWDASSNVVWKVEIPGRGWSSPVVANGRIYLTTAVSEADNTLSLHALCLRASDGVLVWNRELFKPDPKDAAAIHQKNSKASATPIIHGDRLYVHFGHMGTAALDLSGNVVWRQTGIKYPPLHGNGGSPALVGNKLIFSCDALKDPFVVALDTGTGDILWKTPRNTTAKSKFSFCTPLLIEVEGSPQVILPGSGFVAAYNPADGRELWKVRYGEGYSLVPRPVFRHGLLYIATGFDHPDLLAINPKGAHGDATDSNVVWTHRKAVPTTPSLLAVGDELYFVSDGGIASCLDARSGEVRWSERLGGDFSSSPVFADGRIYFQNEAGTSYVLKPGKTFQLLAQNDLHEHTLASWAVIDNTLIIRSEEHLWRIGSPTDRLRTPGFTDR